MLSDITYKFSAIIQVKMYQKLNDIAKNHHTIATIPLGLNVLITDIFIDTIKVPITSLENLIFGAINLTSAPFSEKASLKDASQNIKKVASGILVTPLAILISPLKLISQLFTTLPNVNYPPLKERT